MDQLNLFKPTEVTKQLQLTRPLAVFDLETTGTEISKDRIVEMCVIRIEPDGTEQRHTYRINPTIPIPKGASDVHGIYDADVANCPTFAELAQEIFDLMNPCDLAGFNSNHFDIPVLLEEFIRAGLAFDLDERCLVDVHKIFVKQEPRNLTAAYKFYCDKSLEDAHSALADTNATYEVLLAQLNRYQDLKTDVKSLHDVSNNERIIDSGRRFTYINNVPSFNFGKYKGRSVADVLKNDPGYYNWMLQGDFPMHTKQKLKELREAIFVERKS